MNCDLAAKLNHPNLSQNEKFWEEFSQLSNHDDKNVAQLLSKYEIPATAIGRAAPSAVATANVTREAFTTHHRVEKAVRKLNTVNQRHYDDFIKVINERGVQGLYDQPGRWHFEKIKQMPGAHTVRLDQGTRVLFKIDNGVIQILDVGSHITH